LLIAVLRAFAMLVHYVVSTFQMKQLRPKRDWHTTDDEVALPRMMSDTQQQESQSVAASDTPIMRHTPACHPGSAKRYPGPIHPVGRTSQWLPALRYATAGMTTIGAIENVQSSRFHNPAPPSLRSSRRTPGPRASRVICVESGPLTQPRTSAYAGTSGETPAKRTLL